MEEKRLPRNTVAMRLFSLLLAVVAATATAPARTFTNSAGKSIEAEIVRADSTNVTLRLENKHTATVKIATLSEEDQAFVASWLAEQLPRLRITPNMVRSSKRQGSSASFYRSSSFVQNLQLSVELKNEDNAKGLEESTMKYILVGRSLSDRSHYKILLVQEEDFVVPASGRHTVRFRKAVNNYYESSYSKSGYKCFGYVLYASRKKDNREVYTYGSTTQLREAIYTIIGLESGDLVDENYQKPQALKIGDGNGNNSRRFPQRRPGNPEPTRKPEDSPIIIR